MKEGSERGGPRDASANRRLRSARPGFGTSSSPATIRSSRAGHAARHSEGEDGPAAVRVGRCVGADARKPASAVEVRRRSRPAPRRRASRPRVHGSVRARAPRRWSETDGPQGRRSGPVASRARRSRAASARSERPASAVFLRSFGGERTNVAGPRSGVVSRGARPGSAPEAAFRSPTSTRSRRLARVSRAGRFSERGAAAGSTPGSPSRPGRSIRSQPVRSIPLRARSGVFR